MIVNHKYKLKIEIMGLKKINYKSGDIFSGTWRCRKYKKQKCHGCNGSGESSYDRTEKCNICNGKGQYLAAEHNYGETYYKEPMLECNKCKDCGHVKEFYHGGN